MTKLWLLPKALQIRRLNRRDFQDKKKQPAYQTKTTLLFTFVRQSEKSLYNQHALAKDIS